MFESFLNVYRAANTFEVWVFWLGLAVVVYGLLFSIFGSRWAKKKFGPEEWGMMKLSGIALTRAFMLYQMVALVFSIVVATVLRMFCHWMGWHLMAISIEAWIIGGAAFTLVVWTYQLVAWPDEKLKIEMDRLEQAKAERELRESQDRCAHLG